MEERIDMWAARIVCSAEPVGGFAVNTFYTTTFGIAEWCYTTWLSATNLSDASLKI